VRERIDLDIVAPIWAEEADTEPDEALAARGDADSFVTLYRRHLRPVYSYLYARLVNRDEAEDLTSVAWERVWSSLPNYRPTGSFKGWLFTIVHRTLADHYRQKKPRVVPLGILADVLLDPELGPEEATLLSEQLRLVLQILVRLSQEQQEVLTMRFMAGLRFGEIAQALGKREPAVKMIAYRALEEVRRRYGEAMGE
jgi:RNA polymerase sigma-70 factor, ECF subfamily